MQPARHVKRLHLQAASDEDARCAATAIADALHTASLPGGDAGPLVIIRKLSLGRIPSGAAPASLALHIERITREMIQEVACNEAASQAQQRSDANVVVFSTRAEAILRLSRLHARGNSAVEWFWPKVIPGWRPSQPHAEGWLKLLDAAHDSETATVAAAIVAEAIDSGADEQILAAIPVSRGIRWLEALGWSNWTGAPDSAAKAWSLGGNTSVLQKWGRRWPAKDPRAIWLGTVLALHAQPALSAYSALPASIARSLEGLVREAPAQWSSPRTPSISFQPERQKASTPISPPPSHELFVGEATSSAEPLASENISVNEGPGPDATSHISNPLQKIAGAALRQDLRTPYAGLFFLIPVLVRAGFPVWIASRSDLLAMEFPLRFLVYVARRAGLRQGDPLELKLLGEELQDSPLDEIYREWLTRARKWCRKNAKIGLIALIRRNGIVATTDTHIDCFFDLAQADIRLRRLALDINPGWVPWLGRVVRFHYIDANDKTTS